MSPIAKFKLTRQNALGLNIASVIVFFIGYCMLLYFMMGQNSSLLQKSMQTSTQMWILLLSVFAIVVLHELTHALAIKYFGGKAKFGMKLFHFYTLDVSRKMYSTYEMLVVLLLPLLALTPVLFLMLWILPTFFYTISLAILCNIAGSVGDVYMAMYLFKKGRKCLIQDESDGFSIYAPTPIAQ